MREIPPKGAATAAEPGPDTEGLATALAGWRRSLESVRKSIDEATAAVGLLNATLREMAPVWRSVGQLQKALTEVDWAEAIDEATAAAEDTLAKATALRLEPGAAREETLTPEEEPDVETIGAARAPISRGRPTRVDLPIANGGAPYSYTVTVEEMGSRVKLVPLHQSLSQMAGVRELSLKSYTNGVAVVAIDSETTLEVSTLEEVFANEMQSPCRVIAGEGPSFLVRMGGDAASTGQDKHGSAK
jgi:hypothetical protein